MIYLLTADIAELKADRRDNILIYTGMLLASALGLGLFVYKRVSISESKRKILENETKILKTKIHDKSFDEVIALAKRMIPYFYQVHCFISGFCTWPAKD